MEEQRLYSPRVTRYYKNKRGKKPCYVLILKKKKNHLAMRTTDDRVSSLSIEHLEKKKESNEKRVSSNLFVSTTPTCSNSSPPPFTTDPTFYVRACALRTPGRG